MSDVHRMRCRFRILGGHVHCAIFGPGQGGCGNLTFRVEEWDEVRELHPGWVFIDLEAQAAGEPDAHTGPAVGIWYDEDGHEHMEVTWPPEAVAEQIDRELLDPLPRQLRSER